MTRRKLRVLSALRRERARWDRLIRDEAELIASVGVSPEFAAGYAEGIAFAELVIKRNGKVDIKF